MVHGSFLTAILFGIGHYAESIPLAVLAGILITIGFDIVDYKGLRDIAKIPRSEAVVLVTVMVMTVFVDLIKAVAVGMVLATFLFMKKMADLGEKETETTPLARFAEKQGEKPFGVPFDFHGQEFPDVYIKKVKGPLIFGLASERAIGATRFLILFLVCGALANLVAAISLGDTPDRVIIGSSGAVSAVIGSYLALFPRARLGLVLPLGLYLEFVRIPASLLIAVWASLQVAFTYVGPTFGAVAWWAHISGFLFGVLFALLIKPGIRRRLRRGQ